jgi:ENTS family enterobactin (siderophore) exporter
MPLLVEEHDLVAANALNAMSMNVSRLVGPALGGLLAALLGLAGMALTSLSGDRLGIVPVLNVQRYG